MNSDGAGVSRVPGNFAGVRSALHKHGSLLLFIRFVPNYLLYYKSFSSDFADIALGPISVVIYQCHNIAKHCLLAKIRRTDLLLGVYSVET